MKIEKGERGAIAWAGIVCWTALVMEHVMHGATSWGINFAVLASLCAGMYYFTEVKE